MTCNVEARFQIIKDNNSTVISYNQQAAVRLVQPFCVTIGSVLTGFHLPTTAGFASQPVFHPWFQFMPRPRGLKQHRPTRYIPIVLRLLQPRKVCHLFKLVPQPVRLQWLLKLQVAVPVSVNWLAVVLNFTLQVLRYLWVRDVDAVDTDIHLVMLHKVFFLLLSSCDILGYVMRKF